MKVVDREGHMVPIGTPGELWVRGYNVMLGYINDEEKTREFIRSDGWAKTGWDSTYHQLIPCILWSTWHIARNVHTVYWILLPTEQSYTVLNFLFLTIGSKVCTCFNYSKNEKFFSRYMHATPVLQQQVNRNIFYANCISWDWDISVRDNCYETICNQWQKTYILGTITSINEAFTAPLNEITLSKLRWSTAI